MRITLDVDQEQLRKVLSQEGAAKDIGQRFIWELVEHGGISSGFQNVIQSLGIKILPSNE